MNSVRCWIFCLQDDYEELWAISGATKPAVELFKARFVNVGAVGCIADGFAGTTSRGHAKQIKNIFI